MRLNGNMDKAEDVMLDLAWRRFSEIWQDKQVIEQKASIILASDGVLVGLILNAKDISPSLATLAFWSIALLTISAVFCVLALIPKRYNTFNLRKTWYDLEKFMDDIEQLKLELYGTLSVKSEENTGKVFISGLCLALGTISFLLGIILTSAVITLSILL